MYRVILIFTAFLFFKLPCAGAQTLLNDCANLGVETGTFQAWRGTFGSWTADLTSDTITILSEANGLEPTQHRIRHVSEGNVPEVTAEAIPFVPPGSEYAIQLGNSVNGAQFERLSTSFRVDSSNTLFQYQFAVIFEDPDHVPIEQPKFELLVSDAAGNTLPCGFYQVTAAGNIDGFKSQGKIRYRNWTTAGVDLRDYVGQIVTLQITTYDCSQGGHWGMALFDASCFAASITPINFCPGVDSVITLEAPLGFRDYQWSTGQTTRRITVPSPKVGQAFSVEFSPFSTLSDSCRLHLSFTVPAYVDVLPNQWQAYCGNQRARLVPSLVGDDFKYRWHPGGETTAVIEVDQPGMYTVDVSKAGGCALFDTIVVEAIPAPAVVLDAVNPSCDGKNDGSLRVLANSPEPLLYRWSTADTSAFLKGLSSGQFTVTVTAVASGCTGTATGQLVQAAGVMANAQLVRLPLCDNWPAGEATVTAGAGTPPYTYHWNTGAGQTTTALYKGGRVTVTVTDAAGCQAVDSVWVEPLRAAAETTGNICHDGKDGSITLNAFGGFSPYRYAFGSDTSFQSNPVFTQLGSGAYSVRVQDNSGCIRAFPAEVKNLRAQPFSVALPPDTTILVGESIDVPLYHNYPLGTVQWAADCSPDVPDNAEAVSLRPLRECLVEVQATDTFGCRATAAMLIEVQRDYRLYIPNVFMPAGGYDNSQFYASVYPVQLKTVHVLRIFDRWGSLMFEVFDYKPNLVEEGWNGTVGGQAAPPGVYVYQMDIEFVDGFRKTFVGDVTLIR